jgi:hypothetical protein
MGTKSYAKSRMVLIAAILACVALAMFASCKGNSQNNGSGQLTFGAGAGTTANPPGQLSAGGRAPGAGTPSAAGKPKGALNSAKPGTPPPADGKDAPAGPKVEVTDLLVDAPGADFTGPGRYDVTISALLKEPWEPGVWDVVAIGEDGKEVGKQEIFLALSESKPKMLMFNDFYCDSIPVKIALVWTDKKGDTGGTEDKSGADKGGKGSNAPGGGVSAGGTKPPPPAGKDKGGGGDKGGGDGEGDASTE